MADKQLDKRKSCEKRAKMAWSDGKCSVSPSWIQIKAWKAKSQVRLNLCVALVVEL